MTPLMRAHVNRHFTNNVYSDGEIVIISTIEFFFFFVIGFFPQNMLITLHEI